MSAGGFSAWLHRVLLRFYPAEFRDEFGADMERDFRTEITRRRPRRVWTRTLADWLISIPREQWDVIRLDLRDTFRTLGRSPLFTLVAALSLAIGISANSVVFTIANSLLLQTPLEDPASFVGVLRGDGAAEPSSWLDYIDYRDRNTSFSQFAAWNTMPVGFGSGQRSESVMAETVTDNYFAALRLKAALGRLFTPGDCPGTCAQEVILSHRFWLSTYGGDSKIVGQQVPLSGEPATVIGVAADGFDGMLPPVMTDIWVHLGNRRQTNPEFFTDRRIRSLAIGGSLKDGVSEAESIANLNAIEQQMQRENRYAEGEDRRLSAGIKRGIGIPHLRRRVEMVVTLLSMLAGLVLLISCANVANMILARSTARRQETAMRRALGAGSYRLIRLSLTESLVLASLGGSLGVLASIWITRLLPHLQPPANDLYTYRTAIHPDYRVWAFTLAISTGSAILFGILPALQTARADCTLAIRNLDERGRPRFFARTALVSSQVALSVVLLVAAALFFRSFGRQTELGSELRGINGLIVPLNLNLASYTGDEEKGRRFFNAVKEKAQALPGVLSASLTSNVPLNGRAWTLEVRRAQGNPVRAAMNVIDADYLATMSLPLTGGRNFNEHDTGNSQPVALIDERLVRALWSGASDPLASLGRTILVDDDKKAVQIVGIVRSDYRNSLTEAPPPAMFIPTGQRYSSMLNLVLRTAQGPEELIKPVGRVVESVDEAVSLRRIRTFSMQLRDKLWPIRTGSEIAAWGSGVALLLAVIGLYGVIAYSIGRKRREMGIRIALGARNSDVLRLVLRQGLAMTLWGVLFGIPLALAVNVALARTLYGLRPVDPAVVLGVSLIWIAITCVSCAPPALRAVRHAATAVRELG